MQKIALSLLLALSIGVATTASSQTPQPAAPALDPAWKVPEVIAFIGLKKGDKVADIIGGRLTGSLAEAVAYRRPNLRDLSAPRRDAGQMHASFRS